MRDVIWTIIIIWLVYKVIDLFKAVNVKRSYVNTQQQEPHRPHNQAPHSTRSPQDVKSAMQKHLNNDGEYIDFEEIN